MTNEYSAGKLSIMKCDQCRDGYLIVKPGKENNYFLGCTNYNRNGTGCSKFIAPSLYYEMMKISPDPVPAKEFPKAKDIPPKKIPITAQEEPPKKVVVEEPVVIKKPKLKPVIYVESDLNDLLSIILQCLSHVSEKKYYGVTTLVDILRGSRSQKIKEGHLDQIPEYASLQGVSREDLTLMIEWLIENHFILQTRGPYPVLHPTYDGMHYDEKITQVKLKKLLEYLQTNANGL